MIALAGENDQGQTVMLIGLSLAMIQSLLLAGESVSLDTSAPPPEGFGIEGGPVIELVIGVPDEKLYHLLRNTPAWEGTKTYLREPEEQREQREN